MDIYSRLLQKITILDGAMGTMIMDASRGCNDELCLTQPKLISQIHKAYLEAGSDIITTNSFNSNYISLSEYGLSDKAGEIAKAAAKIAQKVVEEYVEEKRINPDKRPLVAGSMGPTGKSLSISMQDSSNPVKDFDDMADAYRNQAEGLIEGGADLLLLETIFDTLNAKAAIYGIKQAFEGTGKEIPVMISATINENGRLLSGQTLEQFIVAVMHIKPISIGLNCGFGAAALTPFIERLAEMEGLKDTLISLYPNAGLPDALGNYQDSPQSMASEIEKLLSKGLLNIIGGCCGTTPDHIKAIAEVASVYTPRKLSEFSKQESKFRGESPQFIKIGERCNVAGSRKFLRLVSEKNWKECLDIASEQLTRGASVLDINMDDGLLDTEKAMQEFLIRLISDRRTSDIPLMIDSSDFKVIKSAIRLLPIKGIVNSISLKNGEEEFLHHAREIDSMGCAMVVMAFDEKGQADTLERRIEICSRAYRLLTEKANIEPKNIIFDPNVLAVATGIENHDRYALDYIRATEWIKSHLPGARVSGGVSNLSFSFRGIEPVRKAMHTVFLENAISKGMDMAIVNPATKLTSSDLEPEVRQLVEDLLLCRKENASDSLLNFAMDLKERLEKAMTAKKRLGKSGAEKEAATRETSSENNTQKLARSIIEGDSSSLELQISGALNEQDGIAMNVVKEALMKGIDEVGLRFGNGELFLPHVVRSASVMKKAMAVLTPLIEEQEDKAKDVKSSEDKGRLKIVLATVKGDVHDIGKNIVAVVLKCAGYDVIDLGVMVPPEKIIETAREHHASAVGLSGLITPSLQEMMEVAKMMEQAELKIPLFVGGATTSELHTALKIAPLYSGATIRTGDAASLPAAIRLYTSPETAEVSRRELQNTQQKLRDTHESAKGLLSISESRSIKTVIESPSPKPIKTGIIDLKIPVYEVIPLINWRAFLGEWKLHPGNTKHCDCGCESPLDRDAEALQNDAKSVLKELDSSITARVAILPARRTEDDNIIIDERMKFPTQRSLSPSPKSGKSLSIADYLYLENDHIGLFAVTLAGSGIPENIDRLKKEDLYQSLLLQSLSHRLAEAATEWTHRYVRKELWGIPDGQGIRPAIGYPSLPDQSLVFVLDRILHYSELGIVVTENGALHPSATTTGLIIAHPASRYFDIGPQSKEAIDDYAARRESSQTESS